MKVNPRLEFFQRLVVELNLFKKDLPSEIQCWNDDDQLETFTAIMSGPPDTPYFGGKFTLKINIPREYPCYPPLVRFNTRIYHPNIDDHGRICLDLLKSKPNGSWNSTYNINTVLKGIYLLLSTPNADDPLDFEAASQYKNFRVEYFAEAERFTKKYATGDAKYDVQLDAIVKEPQTGSSGNVIEIVSREEIKPLPKFADLIKAKSTKSPEKKVVNNPLLVNVNHVEPIHNTANATIIVQVQSEFQKDSIVRIKSEPIDDSTSLVQSDIPISILSNDPILESVKNEPRTPVITSPATKSTTKPVIDDIFNNSLPKSRLISPPLEIASNIPDVTSRSPIILGCDSNDQPFSPGHIMENRSMLSSENGALAILTNSSDSNLSSSQKAELVMVKPLNPELQMISRPPSTQKTSHYFGNGKAKSNAQNSSNVEENARILNNIGDICAVSSATSEPSTPIHPQTTTPTAPKRTPKRLLSELSEPTSTTTPITIASTPVSVPKKFGSKKEYLNYLDELYPLSKQVRIKPLAVENDPYFEGYDPTKLVVPEVKPKLENLSKAAIAKYQLEMKAYRAGTWKP